MFISRNWLRLFSFFVVFILASIFSQNVFSQNTRTCGTNLCPCNGNREYCCQNGTMCCTGGGCASWACNNFGDGSTCRVVGSGSNRTCRCCWGSSCFDCDSCLTGLIGTCSRCPAEPEEPPTSCSSVPSSPSSLIAPPNASTIDNVSSIAFRWNGPSSWGSCEGSPTYSFRLQIDDDPAFGSMALNTLTNRSTLAQGDGTFRQNVDVSNATTFPYPANYSWRVSACNNAGCSAPTTVWNYNYLCGSAPTAAQNPQPSTGQQDVPAPVTLRWDPPASWGVACRMANNNHYNVRMMVKTGATCPAAGDPGYGLVCQNLPAGTTSCGVSTIRDTDYCWYVVTRNGTYNTTGPVWEFETENPLLYQNWITAMFGDMYAGGITMQFPSMDAYVAPWSPPHLSYERDPATADTVNTSLVSSGDITIFTDNATPGYTPLSQSNLWVENAQYKRTWPATYNGTPPASAIELPLPGSTCHDIFTGSIKLDPYDVYKVDLSCIEDAISDVAASPNGYELENPGYAVIFVTGSGVLRFDAPFTTTNDSYRVVFVTGSTIEVLVDRNLSLSGLPAFNSAPLIEAAFVVAYNMEFDGIQSDATPDPLNSPDDSIMVEGPIVAKTIIFNRNLGENNAYPAEIIKYNPNYIYNLTAQERASLKSNKSGLFVLDVDWVSTE